LTTWKLARGCCVHAICLCLLGGTAAAQTAAAVPEHASQASESLPKPSSSTSDDLGDLVGSTLHDFVRLPSEDTFKWLGVGMLGAAIGGSVDQPVSRGLSTAPRLEQERRHFLSDVAFGAAIGIVAGRTDTRTWRRRVRGDTGGGAEGRRCFVHLDSTPLA
jgi:hypothetical protein